MVTAREYLIVNAVSAETAFPEEDKLRIVNFCIGNIPDGVDCKDCIVLYSLLVQMGIVNANEIPSLKTEWTQSTYRSNAGKWYWYGGLCRNDEEFLNRGTIWSCRMDPDQDGRIVKLRITQPEENRQLYDLSADIGRLERLEDLSLEYVRFVPDEALQRLPNLKSLSFQHCSSLFENLPVRMKLDNLKNLEQLNFRYMGDVADNILNYLRSIENPFFQDTLKTLAVTRSGLNNTRFETLFLEILPSKFQSISHLYVDLNDITSVQPIIERIKNAETSIASKSSLRRLDLTHNPIIGEIDRDEDSEEKAAVLNLLNCFNKIKYIGLFYKGDCLSDLEYALAVNNAGRCLLEGQGDDDNGIDRSLPTSAWPIVLEKAQATYFSGSGIFRNSRRHNCATGIYYLLRNGPALAGRAAFGADNAEKKNPPSKKRKIA